LNLKHRRYDAGKVLKPVGRPAVSDKETVFERRSDPYAKEKKAATLLLSLLSCLQYSTGKP